VGETVKIGEGLWRIVRDIAEEQGFSPPRENKADPAAVRPSSWEHHLT
jgi:hypothetical protein